MAFHALALDTLARKPSITALDVVRLHDALTFDGPVTELEARELFAIELSGSDKHPSWKGFFIDALTEYAIHHTAPHGYLTALKADWLLRLAAPEGRILSANTFALLQTLLSLARWAPERLISTLLDEVYCGIAAGDGPLRQHRVPAGTITERDCDVVRHILYSAGTCGQGSLARVEAEGLLAINSVITTGEPLAAWIDLFGKALGDAMLTVSGQTGPACEVFLSPGYGNAGNLAAGLRSSFSRYRPQLNEDRAIAALERQRVSIITGDDIRPMTAAWLAGALERHHQPPSPAVAVLMEALGEHNRDLDGTLLPMISAQPATRAA